MIGNPKQVTNLNHNGGAIDCYNMLSFYIENFSIQDSKALKGGAISFEETESIKALKNDDSIFYY